MLSQVYRLARKEALALKNGTSVFTTLLSLRAIPYSRIQISVSVSKKVAKKAVDRNRMRRQYYSALEKLIPEIKTPAKMMIFPKKTTKTISHKELVEELRKALDKAKLIS
ncbi:MAG: hypothetical protein COV01_00690 [Candidatus Taylorbacteria bacterium CG10_big_fil_rev_8_21_14_0_10_41_48]|uniref:Ribonuclease P protein component n=1 Tax=Candidatus Taylorbacteria bacterium CG10_big_fil_rev_8_21_14_0_10_41_48 TaxID=1975024 RepID=A0A2M8LD31_9BACT|nr:MAG: hypothetical protein COV01_00690 [Candidatus Taylorbacteria bacterium CG10_big_fil_rev_8_21_14_0_10_41_48]